MSLDTLKRDVQARLDLKVDGKDGILTWTAIHEKICGKDTGRTPSGKTASEIIAAAVVDPRSEKNIATLHPRVQPYARNLVLKAAAAGITIKVISGLRTYAEQTALYAKGRTAPGSKVTNAAAGYSNHNFGLAFDIGVFEGVKYLEDSPKYKAIAPMGIDLGLEWGGNWKTIQDQPHYQLRPAWAQGMPESTMLTELRRRKADGRDFFA
ncbi:M15 family metallopeptidase [Prosthecobacter sp.]|uniref:M15 family metallopeptidase n=1 Tax=Prosthecobacter sp. TaxID=1965333 RepID=UPI0037837D61